MKALKWVLMAAAASTALALESAAAMAQGGGPSNLQYTPRPTVSPYLNLFNDPNGIGVYQTLVRPFLNQNNINAQQSSNINQLQQELSQVKSSSGLSGGGRIRPTGQAAAYMNYSHYYAQQGRGR